MNFMKINKNALEIKKKQKHLDSVFSMKLSKKKHHKSYKGKKIWKKASDVENVPKAKGMTKYLRVA